MVTQMTAERTLIEVDGLHKRYGAVHAVRGLSFAVERGTCFGLLGPNGAGKTTTIEMMEGIEAPTAGAIRYRGEPLGARFRREVGIQFQHTALQDFLSVDDQLRLFRSFYPHGLEIDELVALCSLGDYRGRDSRKLSGGQRQRLLLALALVNDPELVFLDEPTTGLDPQARRHFWELVEAIKGRGKTVILTTHYMEEAYRLCDEILIMDHGQIIARGTPDALLAKHFGDSVVELPEEAVMGRATGLPFAVLCAGGRAEFATDDVEAALDVLRAAGVPLAGLTVRERTLEDLFLELTGRELRA